MTKSKKQLVHFIIVFIVLILFMTPFLILIINTFKTTSEFTKAPFSLPKTLNFQNYAEAIRRMNFFVSLKNTSIITILTVVLNTLISSMTGYFIARKKWKINKIILFLFLASMVAPFQVYMIPLVKIYGGMLGLANQLWVVAYVAIGLNVPFAVFLYHGFVLSIPEELDEAARIDGCGLLRTYFKIIMPLLKPIIVTVMVFVGLGIWNDYLMTSLFLTTTSTKTLALAAFTFLTDHTADYAPMMAGLVLGILPVLVFYLVGQRHIVDSVVSGSLKG